MIFARDVLAYVAKAADLPLADLVGETRKRPIARVRFIAIWVIRQRCPHMSYTAIGRLLNRDHTTILNADRRAPELMAANERLSEIAADAMDRFAKPEIDSLNLAIQHATTELAALEKQRELHLNAGTAALFQGAA